jgi:hypothetical protein
MFETNQQDGLGTTNLEILGSLFTILFYAAALHLMAPLVPSGWRWLLKMPLDLILAGGESLLRWVQTHPLEVTILGVSGGMLLLLRSHLKTGEEVERLDGEEEATAGSSESDSTALPIVQKRGG